MLTSYLSFIDAHCSFYGLTGRFNALVTTATHRYRPKVNNWVINTWNRLEHIIPLFSNVNVFSITELVT